ncbi:MAG: hypothetical protein ACXADY_15915 [Candidatus Hodarchaeales archaeon]|jgi:hypothetical protein
MKIHVISLSPSCFANSLTLEVTVKLLNQLFRNAILINYQDLYGKIINDYDFNLNHNRKKDFELLLLMYDKEKRIVEVEKTERYNFDSLCQLNKLFCEQGITILYSKEEIRPQISQICCGFCFMINEPGHEDIFTYAVKNPIIPSQEMRMEKSHGSEWMKTNIYNPLLTCSSSVQIVDPFIGRELYNIADIKTDKWLTESQWVYSLADIFETYKKRSIFEEKEYSIHTAVGIDEEDKVVEAIHLFRQVYLNDPYIKVKFFIYVYDKSFSPPDEFPHDRYILTNNMGVNIGVGIDIINPDNKQVRRETQLTIVGNKTMASVISQLRSLPEGAIQGKKKRILRRRTI